MCCDRTYLSAQAIDKIETDKMVSRALVKKIMGMTFGEVAELAKAPELLARRADRESHQ
jgi:pantoate kinase